jgi:hypothetical protein
VAHTRTTFREPKQPTNGRPGSRTGRYAGYVATLLIVSETGWLKPQEAASRRETGEAAGYLRHRDSCLRDTRGSIQRETITRMALFLLQTAELWLVARPTIVL